MEEILARLISTHKKKEQNKIAKPTFFYLSHDRNSKSEHMFAQIFKDMAGRFKTRHCFLYLSPGTES